MEDIIILDEYVTTKWCYRNKQHYIDLGYIFTFVGDDIRVRVCDLTKRSSAKIRVMCPICKKERYLTYDGLFQRKNTNCLQCANHKSSFRDLTNQHFGWLTVIRLDHKSCDGFFYWLCQCECGNFTTVKSKDLISSHTRSCGCMRNILNSIANSGSNHYNWQDGKSYEPYCPKFNENLKIRIRKFFNNECVICGKSAEENGQNMSCHHVEYDKEACCTGDSNEACFATLCKNCHSKTNHNRSKWENIFHIIIQEIYGGKSYYTKEEMNKIAR